MASGIADYLRMIRPKFGGAQFSWGLKNVVANASTTIITVSGKGVIYGGAVILDHTGTQRDCVPHIKVDGTVLGNSSFSGMNKYGIEIEHSMPVYLLKYDDVAFVYAGGLSSGISFEESFSVTYDETHGATPEVVCSAHYALQ